MFSRLRSSFCVGVLWACRSSSIDISFYWCRWIVTSVRVGRSFIPEGRNRRVGLFGRSEKAWKVFRSNWRRAVWGWYDLQVWLFIWVLLFWVFQGINFLCDIWADWCWRLRREFHRWRWHILIFTVADSPGRCWWSRVWLSFRWFWLSVVRVLDRSSRSVLIFGWRFQSSVCILLTSVRHRFWIWRFGCWNWLVCHRWFVWPSWVLCWRVPVVLRLVWWAVPWRRLVHVLCFVLLFLLWVWVGGLFGRFSVFSWGWMCCPSCWHNFYTLIPIAVGLPAGWFLLFFCCYPLLVLLVAIWGRAGPRCVGSWWWVVWSRCWRLVLVICFIICCFSGSELTCWSAILEGCWRVAVVTGIVVEEWRRGWRVFARSCWGRPVCWWVGAGSVWFLESVFGRAYFWCQFWWVPFVCGCTSCTGGTIRWVRRCVRGVWCVRCSWWILPFRVDRVWWGCWCCWCVLDLCSFLLLGCEGCSWVSRFNLWLSWFVLYNLYSTYFLFIIILKVVFEFFKDFCLLFFVLFYVFEVALVLIVLGESMITIYSICFAFWELSRLIS